MNEITTTITPAECARTSRREAVRRARQAIDSAPAHVKAVAGAYITPLMAAIEALSAELDGAK